MTDRTARAQGQKAGVIAVVDKDPTAPSALPTPDSYKFFAEWQDKCDWKNEVTVKRQVPICSSRVRRLFADEYQ
jgi:hypothetical protein